MNHQDANRGNRFCHNCGKPMVIKEKLSGEDKGKKFWVCTGFNECKTAILHEEQKKKPAAIKAGLKPKRIERPEEKSTTAGKILSAAIGVMLAGIIYSMITQIEYNPTSWIFGDTSKVTDPYFIPMAKPDTDQPPPPDQQTTEQNQTQPKIMEHIPQQRVNNGEYYQYKEKNGVTSFTDNQKSIPQGAEAKNWNGSSTDGKFEVLKGQGRETPIIVERDQVYVPVKIRSAGIEKDLLLLLDTGATSLVIYQDAAPGIRLTNAKNSYATLANGSQVQQLAGNVDSVSVGPAIARNFEIRVMQQIGQKGHQGLLGMNFLKNYHYTLDMNQKVIRWN